MYFNGKRTLSLSSKIRILASTLASVIYQSLEIIELCNISENAGIVPISVFQEIPSMQAPNVA